MMSRRYPVIACLLLTLFFILWTVPATWAVKLFLGSEVGNGLGNRIGNRELLSVEDVRGTLWSGVAGKVTVQWQGETYSFGEVTWKLRPQSLLLLQSCIEFDSQLKQQLMNGIVCRHLDGDWSLVASRFHGPAALAQLWLPIQVRGNMTLQIDNLRLDQGRIINLNAQADWQDATYHNSQSWLALGALAANVSSDSQGTIVADIFDVGGPVKVDLSIQSAYQQPTYLSGSIQLLPEAPESLAQLLQVLGFKQQGGRFDIQWTL
ncbi:hypothetical protein R50073_38900 [Maricurvus nonylphenolicus]|uniref:type II secretion system protein N n=1 Tax=Maricurvus nonylphenolicus TaxID=1008307 RepID=UPI0036F25957